MKCKRQTKLLIKVVFIYIIFCFLFVSCTSFNSKSYKIESLLNQANNFASSFYYNKAINTYDEILEIESNNQRALYNKAIILYELKKYNLALLTIDESIKNNPNNIKNYQLKIDIYKELNQIENVINSYIEFFTIYKFLYKERYNYNLFLISNFDDNNELIVSELYNNSLILLQSQYEIETALKGLNLINKNKLEHSALFSIYNKK